MADDTDLAEQDRLTQDQPPTPGEWPSGMSQPTVSQPLVSQPTVSAPVVAAPTAQPIRAPAYNPEAVRQNIQYRKMLQSVSDLPTAEAEQAVNAAIRLQAIRGYQTDLQNGVSSSEALAKWAPMLFSGNRTANMGQAAAMVRAQQPRVQRPINAGGVLYKQNPDGSVTPLTQPRAGNNAFDLAAYRNVLSQIEANEKTLDNEPYGPRSDDLRNKNIYLRQQAEAIRARAGGVNPQAAVSQVRQTVPTPAAPAPVTPPATTQATVIRRTKDGRRAVFDAKTHKFVSYAD